jgi:hypothetical protein
MDKNMLGKNQSIRFIVRDFAWENYEYRYARAEIVNFVARFPHDYFIEVYCEKSQRTIKAHSYVLDWHTMSYEPLFKLSRLTIQKALAGLRMELTDYDV